MVRITIEDSLSQLPYILIVVMFVQILKKFHKLLFIHKLLVIAVLLHKLTQQILVFDTRLQSDLVGVVELTNNICQQLQGNFIIEMILEGNCSKYFFGGQFLFLHRKQVYQLKSYNNSNSFKIMGSQITIDKHTTTIDDWLDVHEKLENISFECDIIQHIGCWKFFNDQLNPQEVNILPFELEGANNQTFSPHQAYLLFVVKNKEIPDNQEVSMHIMSLLHSIRQNIGEDSYRSYISCGNFEKHEYYVYSFIGKLAKSKLAISALSYSLKLNSVLISKKKLAIISGGGVLRNKKLQKGSKLPLVHQAQTIEKDLSQYKDIHIISIFLPRNHKYNILNFKSKRYSPFVIVSTRNQNIQENIPSQRQQKSNSIKPPMLKLSLKPFEQVTYKQLQQQHKQGEIQFDIRATARHELKMGKFENECNEIVEGVYVSGEKVAKSWQLIEKHNIKAIVNCAGDYCQNWHQDKDISYLTFFLKDSQHQNIECLFYRVIDFILNSVRNKNNVLVHCIQGISRSITFVIAYVIFKFGHDYKKAELFVKQRRGIACPNNGFMVELIQFYKRLYDQIQSLPNPRAFLVSSHCKETPHIITARMIKNHLFDSKRYCGLDSRGMYIIQAKDVVYIWVGSKCEEKRLQVYWGYAQQYIKKLQKFERAPIKVKAISQGSQGKQFFSLWNLEQTPQIFENAEYNKLFSEGQPAKAGHLRKFYQREPGEESLNKLFIYPDYNKGLGVFELQDLTGFCLLINKEQQYLNVFVWKEDDFDDEGVDLSEFIDNILKVHYNQYEADDIRIMEQNSENPSEQFLGCFN